jgi:DNA primase
MDEPWWTAAVAAVKDRADIVAVINATTPLRRTGMSYAGRCPFHDDRTPSLFVYPHQRRYHCYGCGARGDVIDFVMRRDGLPFADALARLAQEVGVAAPVRASPSEPVDADLWAAAAAHWAARLHEDDGAGARAYLARRGVLPRVWAAFRLGATGAAPDDLLQALGGAAGWPAARLEAAGLVRRTRAGDRVCDRFTRRVMLPLLRDGCVVSAMGRAWTDQEHPAYLAGPGAPTATLLYGADQARDACTRARRLILVEGAFDALALHAHAGADGAPAAAALTANLSAAQARMARALLPRDGDALLAFDGDAGGARGMLRALAALHTVGMAWEAVRIVWLPDGCDPSDLLRADPGAWTRAVDAAREAATALGDLLLRAEPPVDAPAQRRLLALAQQTLAALAHNPAALEATAARLSAALRMAPDAVRRALSSPRRSPPPRTGEGGEVGGSPPSPPPPPVVSAADAVLLRMAQEAPDALWNACAALRMAFADDPEVGDLGESLALPEALARDPGAAAALAAWRVAWQGGVPAAPPLPDRPDRPDQPDGDAAPLHAQAALDAAAQRLAEWIPPPPPGPDSHAHAQAHAQRLRMLRAARAALRRAAACLTDEAEDDCGGWEEDS